MNHMSIVWCSSISFWERKTKWLVGNYNLGFKQNNAVLEFGTQKNTTHKLYFGIQTKQNKEETKKRCDFFFNCTKRALVLGTPRQQLKGENCTSPYESCNISYTNKPKTWQNTSRGIHTEAASYSSGSEFNRGENTTSQDRQWGSSGWESHIRGGDAVQAET